MRIIFNTVLPLAFLTLHFYLHKDLIIPNFEVCDDFLCLTLGDAMTGLPLCFASETTFNNLH